jgi:hypothetical protein
VDVPLPPGEAFVLFTPKGERRWAAGWNPTFLSPGAEDTTVGTVFQVAHADDVATWIVVRCEPGASIEYCAVTPNQRAGLITVTLAPTQTGTAATVTYRLTSLRPGANVELADFAAHYPRFLSHWEQAIAGAITPSGGAPD